VLTVIQSLSQWNKYISLGSSTNLTQLQSVLICHSEVTQDSVCSISATVRQNFQLFSWISERLWQLINGRFTKKHIRHAKY